MEELRRELREGIDEALAKNARTFSDKFTFQVDLLHAESTRILKELQVAVAHFEGPHVNIRNRVRLTSLSAPVAIFMDQMPGSSKDMVKHGEDYIFPCQSHSHDICTGYERAGAAMSKRANSS